MSRPAAPAAPAPAAPREPRATCERCRRPVTVCYCAALPQLATRTRVVILQHPRERDMPIGTARMAKLALPGAALHVGVRWGDHAALRAALSDPAYPPILLWPGAGAKDILREPPAGPVTLVAVDGTWSQAKTVVRDNPVLATLPRYAFAAPEPSQYRIRREPKAEYCSTIEALMHVLGALEGDPARFRALLEPLRAMIDNHLARQDAAGPRAPRRRTPRPHKPLAARVPPALLDRPEDLVCVIGEANAWPYDAVERGLGDELVHWVAIRPATGARFEAVAAPALPLCPSTTLHTRLPEPTLRGGGTRAALLAAFAAFSRPTDVWCTWGTFTAQLFRGAGGAPPAEVIDVRALSQRLLNRPIGALEDLAAALAPEPSATPLGAGRAGVRLAMLAALVAHWQACARRDAAT